MAGNGRSGGEDVDQPLVVVADSQRDRLSQALASHRWLERRSGHHIDVDTKQHGQFPVQPGSVWGTEVSTL